jgi:hypothetical protein
MAEIVSKVEHYVFTEEDTKLNVADRDLELKVGLVLPDHQGQQPEG